MNVHQRMLKPVRRTHLSESFRDSSFLGQYGHLSAQHLPLSVSRGEKKGWEWEIWSLTRGRKETVDISNISLTALSPDCTQIYLCTTACFCISQWLCICSFCVCMQDFAVCTNVKSASKRAVRTLCVSLCHWMSQHVVYRSCCWRNNRASPSESQWASLAAAISALVPLLITSVDHLCAIS